MHAAATLFLDVCVQPDLWPGGRWPLLNADQARNVVRLFALASANAVRQGGIVCRHTGGSAEAHCRTPGAATARPVGCVPALPMRVATSDDVDAALDRATATYVDSGCLDAPDATPSGAQAFRYVIAGVRDAVVFGAGVELGVDRVVEALLQRRIRTHVVLDAVGTADEIRAQAVVAGWKRRGVDGVTAAIVERLLAVR